MTSKDVSLSAIASSIYVRYSLGWGVRERDFGLKDLDLEAFFFLAGGASLLLLAMVSTLPTFLPRFVVPVVLSGLLPPGLTLPLVEVPESLLIGRSLFLRLKVIVRNCFGFSLVYEFKLYS